IQLFSSADSSLRTLASLAASVMRSDLICRIEILSSSSPKDTGTRISDIAGAGCGREPSVAAARGRGRGPAPLVAPLPGPYHYAPAAACAARPTGEVAEWLNVPDSKSGRRL